MSWVLEQKVTIRESSGKEISATVMDINPMKDTVWVAVERNLTLNRKFTRDKHGRWRESWRADTAFIVDGPAGSVLGVAARSDLDHSGREPRSGSGGST